MKLLHIADLHIGKIFSGYNLLEDQRHILRQVLRLVCVHKPDAVLVAGDVYDKQVPSAEAVLLLNEFLEELVPLTKVFLIGGNHDSLDRLSFAGGILSSVGLHIAKAYDGTLQRVALNDEFGKLYITLLPYIRPSAVRRFMEGDTDNLSYNMAVEYALSATPVDKTVRNVLLAHQYVATAGVDCAKPDDSVHQIGGVDRIEAALFADYDYVALGHLHEMAKVTEGVYYSGTPLKYSYSEVNHTKCALLVDIVDKNVAPTVTPLPLTPQRDVRQLRGSFAELAIPLAYTEDYVNITLTDDDEVMDAHAKLREIYPNYTDIRYDNKRTRAVLVDLEASELEELSPFELFEGFYRQQNGGEMTEFQRKVVRQVLE